MRVLYVNDLHGNREKYLRIEELAIREKVAAVVAGGDLLPGGPGIHRAQGEFLEQIFAPHLEKLAEAKIGWLGILGNDDLSAYDQKFEEICGRHPPAGDFPGALPLAGRKVAAGGFEFIGFDLVCDYPFRLKDRCRRDREGFVFPPQRGTGILSTANGFHEIPDWPAHALALPTIEAELARLPLPESPARAVYVIHMPPAGVGLDRCGDGREVGSRAIHRFIQQRQPRLTLHGHIHESPEMSRIWSTRIGRTIAIQPGARAALTGVVIDLETLATAVREEKG